MPAQVTTAQVWAEIEKQMFAVAGMVTASAESRTAGIVYTIRDRKIYFGTATDAWKTRHLRSNPNISLTVTIPKRIPFIPWLKIPPATVTFSGAARVLPLEDVAAEIPDKLLGSLEPKDSLRDHMSIVEVVPRGDFLTYGVGVPLKVMLNPLAAAGRAPVS